MTSSSISSTDLAAQLCSRMCHDLLNPIGALGNGMELLAQEQDPAMRAQCLTLIEDSVRASADKLRFFRLAFGAASGLDDMIPADEPRALIAALAASKRDLEIEWGVEDAALPKTAVRVLLNLAAIAIDALPRGGTLTVAVERGGGATEMALHGAGPRLAFDDSLGQALDGRVDPSRNQDELSGRTAPARLVGLLAREHGGSVQYALSADVLVLGAVLPDDPGDA